MHPNRTQQMATIPHKKIENFLEFSMKWSEKQNNNLNELIKISKISQPYPKDLPARSLVGRVIAHYEEYYRVKSESTQGSVFLKLSPSWNTPLEDALFWVGGWRPSTAFHLLYSVTGLQLESNITEFVNGIETDNLGDLSSRQLNLIDTLHRKTIQEEREITEDMAKQQEKIADVEVVRMSYEVSEAIQKQGESARVHGDRVDSVLKTIEEGMEEMLQDADDLRLKTLECYRNFVSNSSCSLLDCCSSAASRST